MAKQKVKDSHVVLPEPGTNRFLVVDALRTKGLTPKVLNRIRWHLQVSTNCIAEALLLVDGEFERDMDWRHLAGLREVLIQAGFYVEMTTLVKPAPILFTYKIGAGLTRVVIST